MTDVSWGGARGEKWRAQLTPMEATLAPVDEPLIRALRLDESALGSRIAEIGCGGGGTALEILRRAPAGSVVHNFDISPALVAAARARTRADEDAIAFDVADMATAAPDEPYDRLVSRFGVMFFDDAPAAFSNLVRWLVPGGRFAFAVWGGLRDNQWMTIVREVVAALVDVPSPDPDAPGPFRYAEAHKLLALLEGAGLRDLESREWRGVLPIGGGLAAADAASFALSSFASFGELLEKAGTEVVDEARRLLTARLSDHAEEGAVRMNAAVHIITGARLP